MHSGGKIWPLRVETSNVLGMRQNPLTSEMLTSLKKTVFKSAHALFNCILPSN